MRAIVRIGMVAALALGMSGGAALAQGAARASAPTDAQLKAPAKEIFGKAKAPLAAPSLEARAIGFYSKGCMVGAKALPISGETWQVMRLSRNRNWGHPVLLATLEKLAAEAPKVSAWPGLLVGDMAQPRGGPMLTGHASHQIGLDADVWLTPMPKRLLSREEREEMSAVEVVRPDGLDVRADVWTADHLAVIRAAARQAEVERVLVNAAIKKAICRDAKGDRSWLNKVRPYWGHTYHMHVRIRCPAGSTDCQAQDPPPTDEGCGAALDWWFQEEVMRPKKVAPPKPPITLAQMPAECRAVAVAP